MYKKMSRSPPPASDITQGVEQDILYCDSHHVRHVSTDKVLQIVVKAHNKKQTNMKKKKSKAVTAAHCDFHYDSLLYMSTTFFILNY